MNAINIEQCRVSNNDIVISRRAIVKFVYLMIYLYIYALNYKRINAYFNKKADVKVQEHVEEQEERRRILPEEDEPLANEIVAVVLSKAETVVNLENDVNTWHTIEDGKCRYKGEWKNGLPNVAEVEEVDVASSNEVEEDMETLEIYEFEGTGEQLRRLRAYNPILVDETEDDYASRIWTMAYKEDAEEEEKKKIASEAEVVNSSTNEIVAVANEIVAQEQEVVVASLEKDVNTWHTIEDGKCRYKGEWKNGLPNGKGIKHFFKTDSYNDGNFVDGFAEGHGKQTFEQTWEKTVPYYEGEFKRNNYQGKGEYHYGDGDYYKGEWKDGKYHGQGAAYSKRLDRTWVGEYCNDVKCEGNWVKGEI